MKKLLGFLVLFMISCEHSPISDDQNKLPNILLIVADDLGYADIGITGLADDTDTPNIDRLAKKGVRFAQAYDNSPICNQSRTGIITGSYPQRLGSFWYSAEGLHDEKFTTIPELLKQKGYKSGYVGKIHYGKHDSDTLSRSFPLNHGFDYFFGHTSARKHYFHHMKEMEEAFLQVKEKHKKSGQTLRQGSLWENKSRIDTIGFLTTMIGNKSIAFIDSNKDRPFFLQVAFNAAHNFTHQLPKDYLEKYNLSGYRDWDPAIEEYYSWYQESRFPNNEEGRRHFLGQVHYMDYEIGNILNHLDALDLTENTLIFFISDNGGSTPIYANNFPLQGSKYLLYEGGIKTQMIVSYPRTYPKGTVHSNLVSAMDILPTICSATHIDPPGHIDGIDLTPLILEEDLDLAHDILMWDTGHELAVRKGKWKLRKAFSDKHAKYEMVNLELGEFLYNIEKDVGEQTNLISTFDSVAVTLASLHAQWKSELSN